MNDEIVDRLAARGIALPDAVSPVANYLPGVICDGPTVYISGQGTRQNGRFRYIGKLGTDLSVGDGYAAARICGVNLLAQLHRLCGLSSTRRVVRLAGFVNAAPDFTQLSNVLDGASDVMTEAFGSVGRHARLAVGVAALPYGMAVEVEGVFEIERAALLEFRDQFEG